ncbi:MAG: dTMP kinase [Burkholderiaceae bacterium]|jgi:dTMP kinase|nr:dTMP kinase [Burkholderiaceae bacterium]
MTERGRFITFEGIDGAGKSTQIDAVASALRSRGLPIVLTREPGGTALGEALRDLILNQAMTAETETLLLFAARAEHLARVIRPALAAGQWVLCDRFTDATYAYQAGGRGVAQERIAALERWVHADLQPDLTLLFDVPPDVAAGRLARTRAADRFEAEEIGFFQAVRREYLARAGQEPARFFVVDGTRPPEALRLQLTELMQRWSG